MFHGTIDGTSVHPRVMVQRSLEMNAAAVIFCHNHPSGVSSASEADKSLTRRLKDALALIEIRVLDHFIVSAEGVRLLRGAGPVVKEGKRPTES